MIDRLKPGITEQKDCQTDADSGVCFPISQLQAIYKLDLPKNKQDKIRQNIQKVVSRCGPCQAVGRPYQDHRRKCGKFYALVAKSLGSR